MSWLASGDPLVALIVSYPSTCAPKVVADVIVGRKKRFCRRWLRAFRVREPTMNIGIWLLPLSTELMIHRHAAA